MCDPWVSRRSTRMLPPARPLREPCPHCRGRPSAPVRSSCSSAKRAARSSGAFNGAIGLAYPDWPDSTVPNRVIKLLGAAVVARGAWLLTRERVPAFARVATRMLVAIALVGHFARLVLALLDVTAFASEPATTVVDAVALSACVAAPYPRSASPQEGDGPGAGSSSRSRTSPCPSRARRCSWLPRLPPLTSEAPGSAARSRSRWSRWEGGA